MTLSLSPIRCSFGVAALVSVLGAFQPTPIDQLASQLPEEGLLPSRVEVRAIPGSPTIDDLISDSATQQLGIDIMIYQRSIDNQTVTAIGLRDYLMPLYDNVSMATTADGVYGWINIDGVLRPYCYQQTGMVISNDGQPPMEVAVESGIFI